MKINELKNRVAIEIGYPSWDEMENFIIENNKQVAVAQLLVSAMESVSQVYNIDLIEYIKKLEEGSFDGWTSDERKAYLTALLSVKKFLEIKR